MSSPDDDTDGKPSVTIRCQDNTAVAPGDYTSASGTLATVVYRARADSL